MAIDDPLKAAENNLANETRASSPMRDYAAKLAPWLPGYIGKALHNVLRNDTVYKLEYLTSVLKTEFARVRDQVENIAAEDVKRRQFMEEEWPGLLLNGMRRADQSRGKDRIAHIATILTNSLVEQPVPDGDEVEEMMRIAMDLSNRDVLALRIIVGALSRHQWADRLPLRQAHDLWKNITWSAQGFSDSDVESTCSKLASFGLLARLDLPPNQNMLTTEHNGYELLQKGKRFVQFVTIPPARNAVF